MQILVVTYEFPPVGGGGGKAAEEICRFLAGRGHEVRVLTSLAPSLPVEENRDGYRVIRVPCGRRQRFKADFISMARYVLAGTARGARLLRHWRPDVVHTHFAVPSGPVAWALSRLYRVPYVLTAHLGDVPGGVPEKTGRWFRWVYPFTPPIWRDATRVTAISEHTRRLAHRHYPVEIDLLPNAMNLDARSPEDIRVGSPPRLVFAGRFQPQKNLIALVHILSELRHLPWTCALVGDGPLRAQVEAEIDRMDLAERFTVPGWVTPEEVLDWFSRADLLFMPSLAEGLPMVGVQALAMGLAIVASRVGGMGELVREGENGYLCAPFDRSCFREALADLLQDPGRLERFRLRSLRQAGQYQIDRVGERYEAVLAAAAATGKGSDG